MTLILAARPTFEPAGTDAGAELNAAESLRAKAFVHADDRRAFVAAHRLARVAAGRVLDLAPAEVNIVQRCAECGGPHGKPTVDGAPELWVSLSHTRTYVAAAAGRAGVGVDVELPARFDVAQDTLERILTQAETQAVLRMPDIRAATARLWVLKECLVKLGLLTLDDLAALDISDALAHDLPDGRAETYRWRGFHVLEWRSTETGCQGAAVSRGPPRLELLA